MNIKNKNLFCSWSGGKDCCLALYAAMKKGGKPKFLFTMLTERGDKSRSHGLKLEILKSQSKALNIPLVMSSASWENYENTFIKSLYNLKENNVEVGVFGDIDIESHRQWEEMVCKASNIQSFLPLWKEDRLKLLNEFIENGFKAIIVSVKDGILDKKFVGKILDRKLVEEILSLGVDASGEGGELHTVVIDGPIFSFNISLKMKGVTFSSGYWFGNFLIDN